MVRVALVALLGIRRLPNHHPAALGQDEDLDQKWWKLSKDMVGIKFLDLPKN
jgi:hypothetical protein